VRREITEEDRKEIRIRGQKEPKAREKTRQGCLRVYCLNEKHPRSFLREDMWEEEHAACLRKQRTYTETSYRAADKRQYNLDN